MIKMYKCECGADTNEYLTDCEGAQLCRPCYDGLMIETLESDLKRLESQLAESRQEGVRLRVALINIQAYSCGEDEVDDAEAALNEIDDISKLVLNSTPNTKAYVEEVQAMEEVIKAARYFKSRIDDDFIDMVRALRDLDSLRNKGE